MDIDIKRIFLVFFVACIILSVLVVGTSIIINEMTTYKLVCYDSQKTIILDDLIRGKIKNEPDFLRYMRSDEIEVIVDKKGKDYFLCETSIFKR